MLLSISEGTHQSPRGDRVVEDNGCFEPWRVSASADRPESVYLRSKYGKDGRSCIRPPEGDLRGVIKKEAPLCYNRHPFLCTKT